MQKATKGRRLLTAANTVRDKAPAPPLAAVSPEKPAETTKPENPTEASKPLEPAKSPLGRLGKSRRRITRC